jgi:hypothetical protein
MKYLESLQALQENASSFFDKTASKYEFEMKCKEGCSKCCHTDISIFTWEAALIVNWFEKRPIQMKSILYTLWSKEQQKGEDPEGQIKDPCPFLYEDRCSIYLARPNICRTQGLPLLIDEEVDNCPLNFKDIKVPKDDWLDLNRLNTLSSFAQMTFEKQNEDRKDILKTQRISLKKLKRFLMDSF